jgi:mycoredoxin
MPLPLILYGATDCDDTERTRQRLHTLGIAFQEVNIDLDGEAERFIVFVNGGYRSTPTLVFGAGKFKLIVTEPTDEELSQAILRAGYPTPNGKY